MPVCTDPVPGSCPSAVHYVHWGAWWHANVWQPLYVQLALSVLFLLLVHPAYIEAYYRRGRDSTFQRVVKTYIGTDDCAKVPRPLGLIIFHTCRSITAVAEVGIWIWQTYMRDTTAESRAVLMCLTHLDMFGWAVRRLKGRCDLGCIWELNALVDVVTIVPVLVEGYWPWLLPEGYSRWLTLHFLRSYSALHNFERARWVAQLDEHTAGTVQSLTQLVLRVAALLTLMAGTIFTLEVLGDPQWLHDSYLETDAGAQISFFQMVYWIVVTITTVGFGDWSPSTVISRALTTAFIVIGVASIYWIQYSFAQQWSFQHEGTGQYWQRSWGRERHVVVILSHRGRASQMSSLIHGFLQELLHNNHNHLEDHHDHGSSIWAHIRLWLRGRPPGHVQTWPDVVFLSPTKWEDKTRGATFRDFLMQAEDLPSTMQRRVWFLVGEVMSENDLERARVRDSALTYVVSDLQSSSPEEDDGQTIYSALCIKHHFPDVRLRLMVLKPESKELAVQSGIEMTRVFSSHELSASLLAQNVRCPGLIPAVMAMMKSADADDEEFFLRNSVRQRSKRSSNAKAPGEMVHKDSCKSAASLDSCRTLDDIEKVLRKSQTEWCPEKQAFQRKDPWMFEFFEGTQQTVFGFALNGKYEGLSYRKLVLTIYHGCGALLFGVASRGKVILCPQGRRWRAKAGQICFAIARSTAALDPFRWDENDRTSWRNRFQAAKRRLRHQSRVEGAQESAAQLMGPRLARCLLPPREKPQEAAWKAGGDGGAAPCVEQQKCLRDGAFLLTEAVRRPPSPVPRTLSGKLGSVKEEPGGSSAQTGVGLLVSNGSRPACYTEPPALAGYGSKPPWPSELPASEPTPRRVPVVQTRHMAGGPRPGEAVEVPSPSQNLVPQPQGQRSELSPEEQVAAARALRQSGEELVVVIVCHGEVWQQVRSFVGTLRQPYLPCFQPLVILAPTQPPPGIIENDAKTVCIQGSCLAAQSLLEAGVLEATAVVVLAGEAAALNDDSALADFRMVLTAHELECWLGHSKKEVFTVYELTDSNAARHLPRLSNKLARPDQGLPLHQLLMQGGYSGSAPLKRRFAGVADAPPTTATSAVNELMRAQPGCGDNPFVRGVSCETPPVRDTSCEKDFMRQCSRGSEGTDEIDDSPRSELGRGCSYERRPEDLHGWDDVAAVLEEESDEGERLGSGIEDSGHDRRSFWTWMRLFERKGTELERSHDSIMYNQRFAAGQVFTPEFWGLMLGRIFYMPAMIELMEALVQPSRSAFTYPWQVLVPPAYIGRPFAELLSDLVRGVLDHREDLEYYGMELDKEMIGGPPAVPLALYRLRDDVPKNPKAEYEEGRSSQPVSSGSIPHRLTARDVTESSTAKLRNMATGTGGHHFMVLVPEAKMTLRRGDWAVVLGGKGFGRRMHEWNLLRSGCPPAPAS